jgi:hypothetical protein
MRWFTLALLVGCKGSGTLNEAEVDADDDRYVASEDCDDSDPNVHPGGTEVCDGADNDCDGEVDDGVGITLWTDADSDGYGDPDAPVLTCDAEVTLGLSDNAEDCDDADADVNPLGVEVCDDADNDCDGLIDWGTRVPADFPSIQDAIGAAGDGEQVCVSPGTYVETIDFSGRDVHVVGLGGPEVTILDGGGVGPVVSFDTKETAAAKLSGFTITGGNDADGAGIYVRGASPTLEDLIITGNTCTSELAACRGTGLFAHTSALTLTSSVIEGNHAQSVYPYYPADSGAGVYLESSTATLRDVSISGNVARVDDYYGTIAGAGLCVSGGSPVLEDVAIVGNRAEAGGDGVYGYGGGAYVYNASATFRQVLFADNVVEGYLATGGGVYLYYAYYTLTLQNVVFAGNVAGTAASTYGYGGAIYSNYSSPALTNADIVGNVARGVNARGGGLFLTYYGNLTMTNVAVAGNDTDGTTTSSGGAWSGDPSYPYGTVTVAYSDFFDNGADPFGIVVSPVGANGNVSGDPEYLSTSSPDGASWDLAPGPGSALVDAGDPAITDADGTRSDIGSRGGPLGWP